MLAGILLDVVACSQAFGDPAEVVVLLGTGQRRSAMAGTCTG